MTQATNELLSFCIASAVGCMDEPAIYGPLRLLEVMLRLLNAEAAQTQGEEKEKLLEISEYIVNNKDACMRDETEFRSVLQETAFRLIDLQK